MAGKKLSKFDITQITEIVQAKFDEFRLTLVDQLFNEIDSRYQNKIDEIITAAIGSKANDLSQPLNNEYETSLQAVKDHVKSLQTSYASLRDENQTLRRDLDDIQQYTRRPNIRIFGIKVEENESIRDLTNNVKKMIVESGIVVPDDCIDRVHRIGLKKKNNSGVEAQPIIVRFSTFRDRTIVYKGRNDMKKKFKCGISVDLTKSRLSLLNNAKKVMDEALDSSNDYIKFVYSDINCQLRAFTANSKHLPFNSISELEKLYADNL